MERKPTTAQRAEILTQALPYIQKYNNKIVVIKYGGNAMINEDLKEAVMGDIVLLSLIGVKVVLVHGGGPEINAMLRRVGVESSFHNGLRITDDATMEIVQMVLSGKINKGLVTLDRKLKKDAFYAYKAYWSDEKFVHIAGERFVDRPTGEQKIKVYSNCDSVTLTVNGEKTELSGDKIFIFDAVINEGENVITAKSGKCTHKITINGTDIPNPDYSLPEGCESFVRNWFNAGDDINPNNLSLEDKVGDIIFNSEVQKLMKNHAKITLDSTSRMVRLEVSKAVFPEAYLIEKGTSKRTALNQGKEFTADRHGIIFDARKHGKGHLQIFGKFVRE